MNRERLVMLKEMLGMVRDRKLVIPGKEGLRFHMNKWECETFACAAGWAMNYKPFQDMGLHPVKCGNALYRPCYKDLSSWGSLMEFFSLEIDEVDQLFDPHEYPEEYNISEDMVIERIDELLNK